MSSEQIEEVVDNATIISNPETPNESLSDAVKRLAILPVLEYERIRDAEAERMCVRVSVLDKVVESDRKIQQGNSDGLVRFPNVPLWPEAVDGSLLLHELVGTIQRFIVCDQETAIATALWCVFTWVIEHVQVAPLAIITAPEKRCGKSQLLSLMGRLVCNPLVASNISPSATFRVIEKYHPTLLLDEADTFFKDNEELRGVINSGHTRESAHVIRNVGDNHEPKQFSTWGAKAISGIGTLSGTLMDRGIILNLRRKLPHESVERLRHTEERLFEVLTSKMKRFANDVGTTIAKARPVLPEALHDRAQDNWEPLLAIADCAGGEWPKIASAAALKLSGVESDSSSLSVELLSDIKEVFESRSVDRISTADLIVALCADDEKPWAAFNRGKPINPRQFARRLAEYGIQGKTIRIDSKTPRGFDMAQFEDAFSRYLSSPSTSNATMPQSSVSADYSVSDEIVLQKQVQHVADCFTTENESETPEPTLTHDCSDVADIYPPSDEEGLVDEMELLS